MFGRLLNGIYLCVAAIAVPIILWQRWFSGKQRSGWSQKFLGRLPPLPPAILDPQPSTIWLHAVSVGEVLQLRQIVDRLHAQRPDARIVVTTTTDTGHAVAREKLTSCHVAHFPLDFTWSVKAALDRIQPDLICLVELELWPNFVLEAARRNIPLVLVNGRLSEKSLAGYARAKWLAEMMLSRLRTIAVQSEEYRARFAQLGAREDQLVTTGSIKFDGVNTSRDNPRTKELARWMGLAEGAPVLIAGSTQQPEEELILDIYRKLLANHPRLRLVIVPRHPERSDAIARWIEQRGFPILRRSRRNDLQPSTFNLQPAPVALLDTVGELSACWGLADVAFVGGSFGNRGGQNMLEPAAYGAAVCFGPNTRNFRQIVEMLHNADAARTVRTPQELRDFIDRMLAHPEERRQLGERAQRLVLSQQGATDRTVRIILDALPETRSMRRAA